MTAPPAVSVLIKSYNHAPYVGQAIESVLNQSFQDFEILVSDDGSSDGTPDVVRRFTDPRIELEVSPVNRGVSLTMRSLLDRARGRYAAILNSDDFALPGRLERQVAHLDAHPLEAAVFSGVRRVNEQGRPLPGPSVFDVPASWPDHRRERWLRQFFLGGNCLCAPSAMLRRDMLGQIEPHDPRLTNLQDLDLWVRLASRFEIGFIPEMLTAFRVRSKLQNLSALRADTRLRLEFETGMILRHYADMPLCLIEAVFAPEQGAVALANETMKRKRLGELALELPHPSHRLFGLQMLFETAQTQADHDRLRRLTGEVDVFNILDPSFRRRLRDWRTRLRRRLGSG